MKQIYKLCLHRHTFVIFMVSFLLNFIGWLEEPFNACFPYKQFVEGWHSSQWICREGCTWAPRKLPWRWLVGFEDELGTPKRSYLAVQGVFCRSLVSNSPGENDYSLVGFGFIHFLLWPEFGRMFKKLFVVVVFGVYWSKKS